MKFNLDGRVSNAFSNELLRYLEENLKDLGLVIPYIDWFIKDKLLSFGFISSHGYNYTFTCFAQQNGDFRIFGNDFSSELILRGIVCYVSNNDKVELDGIQYSYVAGRLTEVYIPLTTHNVVKLNHVNCLWNRRIIPKSYVEKLKVLLESR